MILLIGIGGAIGAALRYLVDGAIKGRFSASPIPIGLMVVNVTSCFMMGLVYGSLATGQEAENEWLSILGTGFLGGYSTFGSAMLESFALLRAGRVAAALIHSGGMLALSWVGLIAGIAVSAVL